MTHGPSQRKQNKNIDDNNVRHIPVPPDGGYGWIIVIASFLIHIVTDGITYSFGVMYVELLKEFPNDGKGYISWIMSLLCGVTLCSGPISSSFVNKYGCRTVTIVGAIVASTCLFISYWAQNVFTLIITIGFGVGCGLGLIYLPAIVSVSSYFERKRSIAIGIAVAGSGLGTFIFAPLVAFFIANLGWRYTLLVLSGIVLSCALFGSLFRPLKPTPFQIIPNEQIDEKETESVQSAQNGVGKKQRISSMRVPSVTAIPETGIAPKSAIVPRSEIANAHMTRSQSVASGMRTQQYHSKHDTRYMLSQPLLTDPSHEIKPLGDCRRRSSGTLSRPDIFYQGSIQNISNFRSQSELHNNDVEKLGSLPRVNEYDEETTVRTCCGCFKVNGDESFIEMMNFGLLADPIFVVFAFSNLCTCLGFYVPYFCLADKAKQYNMTTEEASHLLATIGMANTLGRIVLGYISDKPWINRLLVYSSCLFVCGIATAASVLCIDYYTLACYSVVFGFLIGAYVGLTSVILVDLLGLDKLTNAFGLLLLFQGIASFIGPPIVGFLYDRSGSYTPGFIFAGSMIALSGFILFFIPTLQRHFAKKQARRENNNNAITT